MATSRMSGHLVDRGPPGGQQRGGHQLERAVLRAGDPHPAGQGRAAGHLEALHAVTLGGVDPSGPEGLGSPHGPAHPHLHEDRRRRPDAPRRHEPGREDRSPAGRLRRRRRDQQRARRRARRSATAASRDRRPAAQHPERPVRRRRRPVHPGRRRTRSTRRCAITAAYTERLEAACDEYNDRAAEADQLHPARRHAGRGAAAPGPRRRPPGRAQRLGAARRRRRAHERRDGPLPQPALGPAVHPGPQRRTRAATSCGSPARTAAPTPSGAD